MLENLPERHLNSVFPSGSLFKMLVTENAIRKMSHKCLDMLNKVTGSVGVFMSIIQIQSLAQKVFGVVEKYNRKY